MRISMPLRAWDPITIPLAARCCVSSSTGEATFIPHPMNISHRSFHILWRQSAEHWCGADPRLLRGSMEACMLWKRVLSSTQASKPEKWHKYLEKTRQSATGWSKSSPIHQSSMGFLAKIASCVIRIFPPVIPLETEIMEKSSAKSSLSATNQDHHASKMISKQQFDFEIDTEHQALS